MATIEVLIDDGTKAELDSRSGELKPKSFMGAFWAFLYKL
jgi:hypothetical protein